MSKTLTGCVVAAALLEAGVLLAVEARQESPPVKTSASPPPEGWREEVLVTADRAPRSRDELTAAVSLLRRADIETLPVATAAEILEFVPGFRVAFGETTGMVPMVSARGFFGGGEAEYVQLLIDGIPVADVESGLADWRGLRAAEIERVEALRGPGSFLYGDTALGGVVQVFTRSADAAPGGEVSATLGSLGSLAAEAFWRTKVGGWRLTSAATAGRCDGFRDHSGDRHVALDASVSHALRGGQFRLTAFGQWRGRDEPGPLRLADLPAGRASSDPAFAFDHEEIRRQRVALSWRRESERALAFLTFQGSARDSRFLRTLLIAADLPDRSLRHVRTLAFAASVEGERRFDVAGQPFRLRAGAEAGREGLETDYFGVDSSGTAGELLATDDPRRHRFALFAVQDLTAFGHARLAFGARHDEIRDEATASETSSSATSPHVALSIRLGDSPEPMTAFVRWSRAFKAATLDQLFDPRPFPDFQGGSFLISNPKLSPQRATALEAGVGRSGRSWRVEAVAYRIDVKDEIDFDPATFRYTNIGRSRHQGLEIGGAAFEGGGVALRLDYGFNITEPRETPGRQLKNIPRHTARAGATARLPGRLSANLHGSFVSRRFLDDGNLVPLSSYVTFGGRLARSFGKFEARLDVLNLLGEDFEEVGYVLPDFSGGSVPYAFPGRPRMVRLQLRRDF